MLLQIDASQDIYVFIDSKWGSGWMFVEWTAKPDQVDKDRKRLVLPQIRIYTTNDAEVNAFVGDCDAGFRGKPVTLTWRLSVLSYH